MERTIPTPAQWDAFVRQHPRAHLLQLSAWGELKSAFGWQQARIALTESGQIVAGAQLLFRSLPFRLGTFAYLPFGGYVTHTHQWSSLWEAVQHIAQQHSARFLKWEAGIYLESPAPNALQWGFRPSPQTIQPPRTIYLDLTADEETLLARMNQGTRRKVRQSLKNEVRYYHASAEQVSQFTALMQTTGTRNAFGVHESAYYEQAYALFVPKDATLILAEHEGDILAGVFVFAVGDTAWYLYGASGNVKRNLMASYGVQWQAILWAKARGCRYYDMWGIPDEEESTLETQFETRQDGLWGVYGFKRGWGGRIVRAETTQDLPYSTLLYTAYQLAVKWRKA